MRRHRDRTPAIEGEVAPCLVERAAVAVQTERSRFRGAERAKQRDIPAERLPHATDRERKGIGADHDQALDRFVELADRSDCTGLLDGQAGSLLAIARPQGRHAFRGQTLQIRDGPVARPDPLDHDFDPATAGQADIDERAALAVDEVAHRSIGNGLPGVERHVILDAAARQETPALAIGHHHLRAHGPRPAIRRDDRRQREGLTPLGSGEHMRADVVLQPGHEPAGAGDRPILVRLVHHAQAIAGRRSRYLSSVSG